MYAARKPPTARRAPLAAALTLALAFVFALDASLLRDGPLLARRARAALRAALARASRFPPPLAAVYAPPRRAPPPFTVPHLVAFYADRVPPDADKLYLVTAGIMMAASKRNFTAVACMVGRDVFPADAFVGEVLHCTLPRRLRHGERLAPVVLRDAVVRRAQRGPVTLSTGVVAELRPGDLTPLPSAAVLHGRLARADRAALLAARSDIVARELDALVPARANRRPRYRLCLQTQIKPNSYMLRDWADYHRRIGVDHVYIFDNGAELDLAAMFDGRPDVEIVPWPYHKSQVQALSLFLFAARARCERVMLEDSDEYPMFGLGDGTVLTSGERPLIRYAKEAEAHGYKNYKLLHLVMQNSGHLHRPPGEVPTNFYHRKGRQTFQNGKSVCYTDLPWQAGLVHACGFINGKSPDTYKVDVHEFGQVKMTPEHPDDPPFLVHYRERSWAEYIEKWDAGRVAGKLVNDERAGSMTIDNPTPGFLKTKKELEYTHFRDKIYPRVLKEGTIDEQVLVQVRDGKRCEMMYKIVGQSVTGPVSDTCAF